RLFTASAQTLKTWPQGLAAGARVPILITSPAWARRSRPSPALSVAAPRTFIASLRFIIPILPSSGRHPWGRRLPYPGIDPGAGLPCPYTEVDALWIEGGTTASGGGTAPPGPLFTPAAPSDL